MNRLKPFLPALFIFCLALLVRVIYNNTVAGSYYPLHDSLFYQTIGFNLVQEHCFCLQSYVTTVYRAPLWPFILGGFSIFFGKNDYVARIFLSILDAGTCALIYLFARDLFGRRLGMFAGIVAAFYTGLFLYTGWLYTETLFTFLLFALCYALFRIQRAHGAKLRVWLLCGVLMGLLSLARPNGLLVIGLFVVWALVLVWIKALPRVGTFKGVVSAALLAVVLIAPWTVRNYLVSHAFVPVATGDGTVMLGAYNDSVLKTSTSPGGYTGTWVNPLISSSKLAHSFPLYTCSAPCEVAREAAFNDAAKQWILHHKREMPLLLSMHFINMWQPNVAEADLPVDRYPHAPLSNVVTWMMYVTPIPIFLLAAFGLVVTFFLWRKLLFLYFIIAMTFAEAIYFYGIPRFRAPIEPIIILLATGALWWVVTQWRERSRSQGGQACDGAKSRISSASSRGRWNGTSWMVSAMRTTSSEGKSS